MLNKIFEDFKRKSIVTKVNIIIISSIITISMIIGAIFFVNQRRRLYKNALNTSHQIAKRLENSLIQPAWEYDFDQINLIITLEMEYPYINAILFQNLYGRIETGKVKDKYGNISNYSAALKNNNIDIKRSLAIIETPIKDDNFTMGKILIYVDDTLLKRELFIIIIKIFLQIIFIALVLAVIVIISLKKIVLDNILLLDDAVQKFSKKDFNIRMPISSYDEMGSLANNFNRMANIISDYSRDMEELVLERTMKLREANEQKTNFFINLAHETKTPLTLISNYLDDYLNKYNHSYELDIIKKNIEKLRRDMLNFLDAEKLERGQLFYDHNQIVDLGKAVRNKILLFKEIAEKKKIKIVEKILTENIFSRIDLYAIDRVIDNLLDNAIRYTNSGGEIKLKLGINENSKIELSVSDTGVGISEEKQKHIFESYYQISHKKGNIQGMGIGLSVVKKIIEQVKGEIEIDSSVNSGTTFTIFLENYIPNTDDAVESGTEYLRPVENIFDGEIEEEASTEGKYHVLVVEDNAELLAFLNTSMKSIYNVYCAKNGLEALKRLENIPKPNVIISDILMDEMDGYEFYKELKNDEKNKDIPLIFLTAKTSLDEKIEGLSKGAIDYLYKPFYMNELLAKINSIIKNQEITKESNITEMQNKIAKALRIDLNDDANKNEFNNKCSHYGITPKEKKVIELLIDGFEYKEISSHMKCPVNTIKKRVHVIYKKLNIHNKVELIKLMSINN